MQKLLPAWGALLALGALLVEPHAASALEIRESVSQPPGLGGKARGSKAKAGTALRRVFAESQAHARRGGPEDFTPSVVGLRYANGRVLVDAVASADGGHSSVVGFRYAKGRILVDAVASADGGQLLDDLRGLGLRNGSRHGSVVSGRMPLAAVERMVRLDSLRSVRVSWKPITNAGTVTSEGIAAMRADWSPATSYDGTGITVGVISDSYDHTGDAAQSQAADDLPATVTVLEDGSMFSSLQSIEPHPLRPKFSFRESQNYCWTRVIPTQRS